MASSRSAGSNRRPNRVAIALGSNLGDRRGHIAWAIEQLNEILANTSVSNIVETEPVDVPDEQPPYLNAVVVGETTLEPVELLSALLGVEERRGRTRSAWRSARTLDLDLVLYDGLIVDQDELTIPHPRFRERAFVLEPLAEVAPDWIDPVTGRTVGELAWALHEPSNGDPAID